MNFPYVSQYEGKEHDFCKALMEYLFFGNAESGFSDAEMMLFCILKLEAEINSNGFDGYFYNSAGDNWRRTLTDLKKIGAENTFALLEKASKAYGTELPDERLARREITVVSEEKEEEIQKYLSKLDEEFYKDTDNLSKLIFDYVKNHIEEFYK